MKIKNTFVLLPLLLISTVLFAQKTVEATAILKAIKSGESITYKNAKIVGVLDFTYMDEALEKLPKKKKTSWWGKNYSDNSIKKVIDVKIAFENCTFEDDVLAYIPDEDSGYTFTADFEEMVIFKNCKFERKAMFKYSRFERNSDFSGSIFDDDTTFKYAEFDRDIDFSSTKFAEEATFKSSKFRNFVSFANAIFEDTAIFKYTRFNDGVSFKNTEFQEDLNIKYMNVSGEFVITNMKVGYDVDAKYTKINGKSFNKYLLSNRN